MGNRAKGARDNKKKCFDKSDCASSTGEDHRLAGKEERSERKDMETVVARSPSASGLIVDHQTAHIARLLTDHTPILLPLPFPSVVVAFLRHLDKADSKSRALPDSRPLLYPCSDHFLQLGESDSILSSIKIYEEVIAPPLT
jgi:hypothetical protein